MKKTMYIAMAAVMLAAFAVGYPEPAVTETAYTGKIPVTILDALDSDTMQTLTEEPKYLALTFDDGPRRGTTDLLLNGLLERGVTVTFFVVGQQIEGNEDLICRMKSEGHQIGNHTYSHTRLLKAEKETIIEEIQKTEVLLKELTGEETYWVRPPYGLIDKKRAESIQVPMIYWTIDPEDWKLLNAEQVVSCVMKQVENGSIILLHDFYPTSVDAALELVDRLQEEGYTFVTVEELFRIFEVTPEAGVMYASPQCIRPIA